MAKTILHPAGPQPRLGGSIRVPGIALAGRNLPARRFPRGGPGIRRE
jgi:hypothetical protein